MAGIYNEKEYKDHFQRQLLTLLVNKYEASKSFASGEAPRQKPRIVLKNGPFQADYEDEMDFRKKEWMHDVIARLSDEGIVSYKWEKYQEGRVLAGVYLEPDHIASAYEWAGIMPRELKMERLRNILLPLVDHPWAWVADWAAGLVQSLMARKSSGLDLDDRTGYELLVQVLSALPGLDDEMPKRVLSQRLFQDTKVFERQVARRLVHLIQTCSGAEFESDTDALASVGIADHPSSVFVSGRMLCSFGNEDSVPLGVFQGGVGLSRETVRNLEVTDLLAERVVLIENLTSWHQWVSERRTADEIVIYTGGYPNRTVQQLLKKFGDYMMRQNVKLPVCHWGDMDLGGIRIYEFIRIHYFPALRPLWMDEQSYLRYAEFGLEISSSYESKIRDMLGDERFARWHGLLGLMLKHGKRIEQESMVIALEEFEI